MVKDPTTAAAKKRPSPLRVTELTLSNWRNFKSVNVKLANRAFFVGPNASGKSNLLDSLRFLRDISLGSGGGLQEALRKRGGFSAVRCIEARNPSHVEVHVALGNDSDASIWTYTLQIQKATKGQGAIVQRERITGPKVKIDSKNEKAKSNQLLLSQTRLEQVSQNIKFRPVVEFFQSIRYLHVVPQVVRDPRRSLIDNEDPHGGDLLRRIADASPRTRDPRLRNIAQALRIAVPQFKDIRFEKDSEGKPHIAAAYQHWRPNATWHREDKFSDGTLRLLGFLWSLAGC